MGIHSACRCILICDFQLRNGQIAEYSVERSYRSGLDGRVRQLDKATHDCTCLHPAQLRGSVLQSVKCGAGRTETISVLKVTAL